MTDDVAEPRDPKKAEGADAPPPPTGAAAGPAAGGTPHPESSTPPGGSTPPGPDGPPFWGYAEGGAAAEGAFASRYGLVRPLQGRYLAGVCAAIGRATNTDPILWRVLLAVLGFFGGLGVLVYVAAWLIIPAEGDDTSPFESMLGRGRSSMTPLTVILLSLLVVVLFGFIVTDQLRAVLLGAAIIIAGVLLVSRNGAGAARPAPMSPPAGPPPPRTAPAGQAAAAAPTHSYPTPAATPAGTQPAAPSPSPASASTPDRWSTAAASAPPQPPAPPTAGAYRPPFAPYGPYAGPPPHHPPGPYPPPPPPPPKPPAPPRESSPLGAVTFSMIFVAVGLVALLDLGGVIDVRVSGYFAAVLVTIALGLLVGTWFGRARWLIALGLVATAALGISTAAESHHWHGDRVVWDPASYSELATDYEITFGDATLDLTRIDFTDRDAQVTVRANVGEVTVILPEHVDVTVTAEVNVGDAQVLGNRWSGLGLPPREVTDYGADGPGGGQLHLYLYVNAGDLEVRR
ncbi:MAG TPA: PspC domain-containing protein [Micromonosporaceae bacterium]|nr:PspC domain-containing protein [Micromonosporaceae bacterium]